MPPPLDELRVFACVTEILPGAAHPVYGHGNAGPPRRFWWGQRTFLGVAGVKDGVSFRKQEKRRQVWPAILHTFCLHTDDVGVPVTSDGRDTGPTCVLSTSALLAWLGTRREMALRTGHMQAADNFGILLSACWRAAKNGHARLVASNHALPQLALHGHRLEIAAGCSCDLRPLLATWPGLLDDWEAIAPVARPPLCAFSGCLPLESVFDFLLLRCRMGQHNCRLATGFCNFFTV